jgi:hypothetical protein
VKTVLLAMLLLVLLGCQQHPLTPEEIRDQQIFMTGCRAADAALDPTAFEAYCVRHP